MADGKSDWQATASLELLRLRAQVFTTLREFFAARDILEVETPILSHRSVTDVHLQSFSVTGKGNEEFFLQTSPEYAMKRLLASGSGSIYQITKAFRSEEQSRQHNPEFTMLEWYRLGFDLDKLMDEVEELIVTVIGCSTIPRFTYQELFEKEFAFNPHDIDSDRLQAVAQSTLPITGENLTDTDYLQLLMNHQIEPTLPSQCFVYDYPIAQAALSKIEQNADNKRVAKRFELYCNGMEIANGYSELTDPQEQKARFQKDNQLRMELGLRLMEPDERLLGALEQGMPECAGVALGIDRLVMLVSKTSNISDVISFPFERA